MVDIAKRHSPTLLLPLFLDIVLLTYKNPAKLAAGFGDTYPNVLVKTTKKPHATHVELLPLFHQYLFRTMDRLDNADFVRHSVDYKGVGGEFALAVLFDAVDEQAVGDPCSDKKALS